tara:strand:- start:100 stop:837 length:738 start_codon:yes stop_codon:yes gene_type:complete
MLTTNIKKAIKTHALSSTPKECCGILYEKSGATLAHECMNVSEEPEKHFSIRPRDYLTASKKGSVKAVYHSHVSDNNKFSPNDMINSRAHQVPFVLYSIGKDCFSTFDPRKNKTFLYDRTFKIGETDCYTVVKEYYKDLGIEINGRNDLGNDWHKKDPSLIQKLFELNKNNPDLPIIELGATTQLQKHDVIVFEFIKGRGPNHVAVYLDDGNILHHPRNKYLSIEPLSNTYKKTICKIYRHEQLS